MVVILFKVFGGIILDWDSIGQDIVDGLDVEGFFDFGVGGDEEVGED